MSEGERAGAADQVATVTPAALHDRIERGEDVFLLDARAAAEFEEWHVDGDSVEAVNHPYFELLDGVPEPVHEDLPADRRITVLCAKGGASEMIADELEAAGYDVEHLADGMQGWARLYVSTELETGTDATVLQYHRPSSGCLAYLVVSDGEAIVVDPLRAFTDEYVADARDRGATLTRAIDTHVHADHVSGVRSLAAETDATAVLPELAAERGVDYDASYETVADGETVTVGTADVEAVHVPGHTTGMTVYRVGDVVFTGDSLFTESVARPDLEDPEAAADAARTLHGSLHDRLLSLPDDTVVAPGHASDVATPTDDGAYVAELGALAARLDALAMDQDAFAEFVAADLPPRPANHESIIATNLGHESPDDETAFELELGPNNCAASADATSD